MEEIRKKIFKVKSRYGPKRAASLIETGIQEFKRRKKRKGDD
jgi:hypothetical protein